MLCVAFGHEKNVGKDSAARFCITELRLRYPKLRIQKRGFADKLKQQCYELYSWAGLQPAEYYEDNYAEREVVLPSIGRSPRQIWIEYGMAVRAIYPDTWVRYLLFDSGRHCDLLFIKDLRFPNEGDMVNSHGGRVYKIERPSVLHTSDEADDALIGWGGFYKTLLNNGDLKSFYKLVTDEVVTWIGDKLK